MSILHLISILLLLSTANSFQVSRKNSEEFWFPNLSPSIGDNKESPDLIRAIVPAGNWEINTLQEVTAANLSKTHFFLHTNENLSEPDELFVGDLTALENSHFHQNGPLWILVHGFGASIGGSFPFQTGLDLLSLNPNGNVILLDYSELVQSPDYIGAVINSYAVSNYTAELLQFLFEENAITPEKTHLVGFSLGGQVVGITGKRFQWLTNEIVGRVTALDPAFILFDIAEDDDRISSDDATFVDVFHTAAGIVGMVQPRGHIDYYPNGGTSQNGCGIDISCSHGRAPAYFKESITGETNFHACQCLDWDEYNSGNCACNETVNMGHYVDQSKRGKFYLRTNAESPFAMG